MRPRHKKIVILMASMSCLSLLGTSKAYADITNKPISYSTESRPLSDVINQVQNSLGGPINLKGGVSPNLMVQGEFSGNNGYAFIAQIAKKLNLEWAATDNQVFLAPAGSVATEQISVGNPDLANAVARKLTDQFKNHGSNIAVSPSGNDINITGLSWWINAVKGDAVTRAMTDSRKELLQSLSDKSTTGLGVVGPRDILINSSTPGGLSLMIFKLKNAWAEDKTANVGGAQQNVPGVSSLFSQVTGVPKLMKPPTGPAGNKNDPSGTATSIPPLPAIAGGFGNSPMNTLVNNTSKDDNSQDNKKADPMSNQRSVIADPRQNAVIVRDSSEHYDTYKQLINYMDQSAPMIQIDAYIVDLQKNEATDLGFGLSWSGGKFGNSSVTPGGAGTPASPNVILSSQQGVQLLSKISALETRGLSQVVSVPTVLALNNLEATFSTRQTFYVPVQGNQDASLTSVTAQTFLRVTPMFTNEGEGDDAKRIKISLDIQDSSVDNAQSSQVSGLPQVTENQIATQAVVNNGDTLVIGGQVVRKIIDGDSGFPFLSRMPILGLLFGQRSRQYQEFLRIYIISPRLLGEDSLQAAAASVNQPNGTISNNKMLREDLPKIMQGTSMPSNPNINLAPGEKEQDNMNSIFMPVPTR
jgi:type II secretory pathway component GspD/PulD (secretin)